MLQAQHTRFIEQLAQTRSRKQREALIRNADRSCIAALVEIVFNFLRSEIPLSPQQKARLRPHSSKVRQFSRIRSEKRARKFLVQRGGFAPAIIAPILTAIASGLLSHIFEKQQQQNDSRQQNGSGPRARIQMYDETN